MGSKHKSKEKKRKREGSLTSSDSDGDERTHREKAKKHKKEKKRSKDDKKLLKDAKKFLKQKLKGEEQSNQEAFLDSNAQIIELTRDSYFEKNPEFTAWLRDERGVFFNDLPSAEARDLFEVFTAEWNSRKLKSKYYNGITPSEARRTQHKWGIKGKSVEEVKLGIAAAMEEEREARGGAREAERAEVRRWKADQKLLLDEMLPKESGREALVQQRLARREEAKGRDNSPDTARIPGGGDMYGGDDTFASARARESQRDLWKERQRAQKSDLATARLREAEAKEEERMAQFRALAAKGPISIAKRG